MGGDMVRCDDGGISETTEVSQPQKVLKGKLFPYSSNSIVVELSLCIVRSR